MIRIFYVYICLGVVHINRPFDRIDNIWYTYIIKEGGMYKMKELMGGLWLGALVTGALGLWIGTVILGSLGLLAGAAASYTLRLEEKQAASWRKNYPSYKY